MNFFSNLSIGAKFLSSSLLIVGILTIISWQSISSIEHCHHACTFLLEGAMTTKSLAQSAQTSFYALTETANQTLLYARLGESSLAAAMQNRFITEAQALANSIDGVLQEPIYDRYAMRKFMGLDYCRYYFIIQVNS